jgi:hypothetical protein
VDKGRRAVSQETCRITSSNQRRGARVERIFRRGDSVEGSAIVPGRRR